MKFVAKFAKVSNAQLELYIYDSDLIPVTALSLYIIYTTQTGSVSIIILLLLYIIIILY